MKDLVSAAVVNFQTPDLLRDAVQSFRGFYPDLSLLIVENGSQDESAERIEQLRKDAPDQISVISNEKNRFHGPAMDQSIRACETPYVYIFDSDTKTLEGGFLESMIQIMESDSRCYSVGNRVAVSKRGFARPGGLPVPVSAFMLIRKNMYVQLSPFEHHGLPVLKNFTDAARKGWRVRQFAVEQYVEHLGRGTADRFGYGLGLRSRLDYLLNRLGL